MCRFALVLLACLLSYASCPAACIDYSEYVHEIGAFETPGLARGIAVVGTTVYIADGTDGLRVVDMSDPLAPVLIGWVQMQGTAVDVSVSGGFAYVASSEAGLQIVDLSQMTVVTQFNVADVYAVASSGRTVYLASNERFYIIDATDPQSLIVNSIAMSAGYPNDLAVDAGYAYVPTVAPGRLFVARVSDPAHPQVVSGTTLPCDGLSIAVAGTRAYVNTTIAGLQVFDVSDVSFPHLVGSLDLPDQSNQGAGVAFAGSTAYVSNNNRVYAIDCETDAPTVLGSIEIPVALAGLVWEEGTLYVGATIGGLRVLAVPQPFRILTPVTLDTPGSAQNVTISGARAYVASGASGLVLVDVSDPANPQFEHVANTPGYARGVAVSGEYAFVADDLSGVQVFWTEALFGPGIISTVTGPGSCADLELAGSLLYVAAGPGGLWIVDGSDPYAPHMITSLYVPGNSVDLEVAGTRVYLAAGASGLEIADVSDPADPGILGYLNTPGSACALAVDGNLVYLADGSAGIRIIDVSNPASPQTVSAMVTVGDARGVRLDGRFLYVVLASGTVRILDVQDPVHPVLAGAADLPPTPGGVAISGESVYVANGESGLSILNSHCPAASDAPDDASDVAAPALRLIAAPNPFRYGTVLGLCGAAGMPRAIEILDSAGRVVRGLTASEGGALFWDGRDGSDRPLPAGVYLVRAIVDGRPVGTKVILRR